MTITQVKCDVCGVVKQETNHWFLVFISSGMRGFDVRVLLGDINTYDNPHEDVCGSECLHKLLDKWIRNE